jgi:hypothetical protein
MIDKNLKRKKKLKTLYANLNSLVSDALAYFEKAPELLSARLMRELQQSLAVTSKLVEQRADVVTVEELDKNFLLQSMEQQLKFEEDFFIMTNLPPNGALTDAAREALQPALEAYLAVERERMERHINEYEAAFLAGDVLPSPEENDASFFITNQGPI